MTTPTNKIQTALELLKRPEGLTQLEASVNAAGTRLSAQIFSLSQKGHQFRSAWEAEGGSRYKRYFWIGYCPECAAQTSETPHIGEEDAGSPPIGDAMGGKGGGRIVDTQAG